MKKITNIKNFLVSSQPYQPLEIYQAKPIEKVAALFKAHFQGKTLYAVKANPSPFILKTLLNNGITNVDVASLNEIKHCASISSKFSMYYMNPIKPKEHIREAYFKYNIKAFSLDCLEELDKICEATQLAQDLKLFIRVNVPHNSAQIDLSSKFGASFDEAIQLLRRCSLVTSEIGVCFHIGSQCMDPQDYGFTIRYIKDLLTKSETTIKHLDIGGGFPISYPLLTPPPLTKYFSVISKALKETGLDQCQLYCEPGRALSAESMSLIVRVEQRRDHFLYINDGLYGTLFDAGTFNFHYPAQCISSTPETNRAPLQPFSFYGPTCDSYDLLKGPFYLPQSIAVGDYIKIDLLGAYGSVMKTSFNGFNDHIAIELVPKTTKTSIYSKGVEYVNY